MARTLVATWLKTLGGANSTDQFKGHKNILHRSRAKDSIVYSLYCARLTHVIDRLNEYIQGSCNTQIEHTKT